MLFSIIIINYRTPKMTAASLQSIFAHYPAAEETMWEIIVIDNNSDDGSAEFFEQEFGTKIKLIKNSENFGFAKANNQGARIARGRYLLFLNSDTLLTADIFKQSEKIFSEDENIGIISPRLLLPDGTAQAGAYGRFPTLSGLIFKNRLTKKIAPENNQPFTVDWTSGCALFIRRDLFEKIGGWDEKFFLYFEDVDLCRRVAQAGRKTIIEPRLSLIHFGGQSLQKNNDRRRHYYQAQNYYFQKYYGPAITLAMKIARWPYKIWMLRK